MPDQDRPTADRDDFMETVVVQRIVALHPETLTESELILKITQGRETPRPGDTDAVIRAIAELAGDGVIHREAGRVHLCRPVCRFHQLTEDH